MKKHALIAALSVAALISAVGCSKNKGADAGTPGAAGAACGSLLTEDAAAKAAVPADLKVPNDLKYTQSAKQGATRVIYGYLPESSFVNVRDEIADDLTAAGYTITSKDQEAGAAGEAEARFTGPHEGSIRVNALCKDHVQVRIILNS